VIFDDKNVFPELSISELRRKRGAKWAAVEEDKLPAWVADMDFQVASEIRQVLYKSIDRGDLGYPDIRSRGDLAEIFAVRYYLRHGLKIDPGLVLITSDVVQAIAGCIYAFSDIGDKVLFLTPTYPPFFSVVNGLSRQVLAVDMVRNHDSYQIDFDLVKKVIAKQKPRVLLLCNPHNPTGRVFTYQELEILAELALLNNMVIISDEIHCDLVFQDYKHIPIAAISDDIAMRTITLSSASKTFNIAGLHCAQMAFGSSDLFNNFGNCPSSLLGGVNSLGIDAAVTAYKEGTAWLDSVMELLTKNRLIVADWAKQFSLMQFGSPEATYLAWMDLNFLGLGDSPAETISAKAGIVLSDGFAFGAAGAGHVRLNFATGRAILEEILSRLGNFISDNLPY